jgi:hypothetical protein
MVEIEGESVSVSVPKGAVFVEDFESGEEREYQGPCIVEMQKTR